MEISSLPRTIEILPLFMPWIRIYRLRPLAIVQGHELFFEKCIKSSSTVSRPQNFRLPQYLLAELEHLGLYCCAS